MKVAAAGFFAFLAQVETIAIEIPLKFLPHVGDDLRPKLRQQLVDEVFHSTLFARIAHELYLPHRHQPPPPLQSAEALLKRIREEDDLVVSATLLNLVAEGWIETLFDKAKEWGIADDVFTTVLADEERHVQEADIYLEDSISEEETRRMQSAVAEFESGLVDVLSEPMVAMSIYQIAGHEGFDDLSESLIKQHENQLEKCGLEVSKAFRSMLDDPRYKKALKGQKDRKEKGEKLLSEEVEEALPVRIQDTPWRWTARHLWDTPRDPTMRGNLDIPVGHIPRKLLTPVFIAAIGRAWATAEGFRLNRVLAQVAFGS